MSRRCFCLLSSLLRCFTPKKTYRFLPVRFSLYTCFVLFFHMFIVTILVGIDFILIHNLQEFLWSPVMLAAFFAVGLAYTVYLDFFPLFHMKYWLSATLGSVLRRKNRKSSGVSSFEAMSAALAGSMGIGNIAGVASALAAGGPGAIFWMWASSVFGMMTKYAEIVLGYRYRHKNAKGEWYGGPMYYIKEGLRCPILAGSFALFGTLAAIGMGNMTQSNSISNALYEVFQIPPVVCAVILIFACGLAILGGFSRIARISSILIPFASVFYLAGSIAAIILRADRLPAAIGMIFADAFSLRSAFGGAAGYSIFQAVRTGVARGVFSNEAGLGSSVLAHAASDEPDAVKQGMWGIFEVFADTLVVCTITALVILTSGLYDTRLYASGAPGLADGIVLASRAFCAVFGAVGGYFTAAATVIFAFATLIAWSHYGAQCCSYLFGDRALPMYQFLFLAALLPGCLIEMEAVWEIADTCNGLMAIPNLIALCLLFRQVTPVRR